MITYDLLYVDAAALSRIRRATHQDGDPLEKAVPPRPGRPLSLLHIPALEGRSEIAVHEQLVSGRPLEMNEVNEAVHRGARPDGRFAAPTVLVEGELRLALDPVEALKLTVTTAIAFAPGDEELTASLKPARDFLETAAEMGSASVAESLAARIRDAFARTRRSAGQERGGGGEGAKARAAAVPDNYLEAEVHRALVEQRRYRITKYAGSDHARAALVWAKEAKPATVPCFVPSPALAYLPLCSKLSVRMFADAQPVIEKGERIDGFTLRVLALARPLPTR